MYQQNDKAMETITKSQMELNEQIIFAKDASIFISRIIEVKEKAVKVDYCFESVWSNPSIIVYTYTMWIPKSVIIHDEIGGLTVKKWFAKNGLQKENTFFIKKYFINDDKKVFV